MSQMREILECTDQKLLDQLKRVEFGLDEKLQEATYRELNRRYIKRAADRVIVAAIITGVATISIQILSIFAGK